MSEVEEKNLEISQEELDKLPKDTVHCFPASKKQIIKRRIITLIIAALDAAAAGYLLAGNTDPGPLLWCVFGVIMLLCVLVFIHTFVIAKYRVAMDYQKNEVALRYRFSRITIPFDSLDARDGAADRATQLLQNSTLGANMEKVDYLILDNVYDEVACYQTSSKDLATKEDFDMLAKEAKLVSSVYKAKEKYDALNIDEDDTKKESEDNSVDLVKEAIKEDKAEKAEKAAEEAAEALKEAAEEAKEEISSEEKDSEEK
ncbi:MAG: hypothetical protein J6Y58_10090 [Clostridiales bacterium]|nr:hypothetical protein [Clostridiales bacterium]MBP5417855.1 hypothetical protein [Clostridiales bacterium]